MMGFPNDKLSEVHMGTEFEDTEGSENVARALAFMMTLNYSYKQRYALDYSMSVNASSEFPKFLMNVSRSAFHRKPTD